MKARLKYSPHFGDGYTATVENKKDAALVTVIEGNPDYHDDVRMSLLNSFAGQYEYFETRKDAMPKILKQIKQAEERLERLKSALILCKRKNVRVEIAPQEYCVIKIDHKAGEVSMVKDWHVCDLGDAYSIKNEQPKIEGVEYRVKNRELKK